MSEEPSSPCLSLTNFSCDPPFVRHLLSGEKRCRLYFLDYVEDIYIMVLSVLVSTLNPNRTYLPLLLTVHANHPAAVIV